MLQAMALWVDSEIGKLKKVVIHSPGCEIEVMTPEAAEQVLYNDIIPLQVVAKEHRELAAFLAGICNVYQIQDLLCEVMEDPAVRSNIEEALLREYGAEHRREELTSCTSRRLSEICIHGLRKESKNLRAYLSPREFDILPLPNLFFTRDSAMVYRDSLIIASMASAVRNMESVIMYHIGKNHQLFRSSAMLYEGNMREGPEERIEGGDCIVLSPEILCIGISERTGAAAVDVLVQKIVRSYGGPLTVFAVLLPRERATIHLDMVFTQIDTEQALVHYPLIVGRERLRVVRIDVGREGDMQFSEVDSLLQGLADAGLKMDYVCCGGPTLLGQKREQWMSGANMFAFAPGKIIGYGANEATFCELAGAGYTVKDASDFIEGGETVDSYSKLAVKINGIELARGGGGIRCMTMPIERA